MSKADQENSNKSKTEEPVNGNFKFSISDDKLAVFLTNLSPPQNGGEAVTVKKVVSRLKKQKITFGIDKNNIETILSSTPTDTPDKTLYIAKGTSPVDGVDAELSWNIHEQYLRKNCAVILPGETIANHQKATKGTPGKTIYGKKIPANNGKMKQFFVGSGIKTNKTETIDEYQAIHLGIVTYSQEEHSECIQVDRLLHIDSNKMNAQMNIYAESASGQEITLEIIMAELSNNGITYGIDEDIIQLSLKKALNLSSNKPIDCIEQVAIAHGTEAQPGKDASLIISQDENTVGAELSNGFIDFHELGYPWNANQNDRIGYLLDAKPGVEGTTITGTRIKVRKPKNIKVKLDGLHKDENGRLIADIDGALIINSNKLSIVDLLVINSDINFETGNVHSIITVHVKGHIKPDFILESEKDIIIDHNIEDATVRSGNSIMIKGGIRGMKSHVYSPSDIYVGFVENASIYVNENLSVNGSILNSIVASNGTVTVGSKKTKHSMVAGGELTADKYLEVSELGSTSYVKTIIRMGIAQEERRQIILIDKETDEILSKFQKIEQIQYRHRLTPIASTNDVLFKLAITRKSLQGQIDLLAEKRSLIIEQLKKADSAKLVVKKCVYPGVIVFINDRFYKVNNKLGAGTFTFNKDDDKVVFIPETQVK
jgi:uncharacterized protein